LRLAALIAATLALLVVRVYAAHRIGFGDAEALYACYARHPQPVYLDHPGLIGVFARALGGGDAPSPLASHLGTAIIATAAPWLAALTARAAGASWSAAGLAAGALMLAPEISVGLFGMTPDLLLFVLWYASVLFSVLALKAPAGSLKTLVFALVSGFATGLACDAKISGVLLLAGLGLGWLSPLARPHRRSLAPYGGAVVALLVFSPVVLDEFERGFPMLRHRLVTQAGAGPSLRNLAVLVGGQVLYVTPPLLWAAAKVARDLYERRKDDVISSLLWSVTVAGLPLVALACVSRAAEPHWVAPLYLALPLHFARSSGGSDWMNARASALIRPMLGRLTVGVGAAAVIVAHAWVLIPLAPRLLGAKYEARYDLANDLYAWRTGLPLVKRAFAQSVNIDGPPPVVIGPHWTVCAQLHAALPVSILVGCEGNIPDDFSRWLPRSTWQQAPIVLYVTDDRFGDPQSALSGRRLDAAWQVDVERGGVPVRRISVTRLVTSASASH
jgi:hypothetical protein